MHDDGYVGISSYVAFCFETHCVPAFFLLVAASPCGGENDKHGHSGLRMTMKLQMTITSLLIMIALLFLTACSSKSEDTSASSSRPSPTEEPEYRFNQILGLDAIRPVYDPQFIPADQADLDDEQLVLGLAIDGEAKAYPIYVLNHREMVNDVMAGIQSLATW